MKPCLLSAMRACLFVLYLSNSVYALEVTLPVTDDAWTNASNPTANFGTGSSVLVNSSDPKTGFVKFDISAIVGAKIESATLKATINQLRQVGNVDLFQVTGNWNESMLAFAAMPSTTSVPSASSVIASGAQNVSFDITDLVRSWADGSSANEGVSLTSTGAGIAMDSKEKAGGIPMVIEVTTTTEIPTRTRVSVPTDFDNIQAAIDGINSSWCASGSPHCTIAVGQGTFDGFHIESQSFMDFDQSQPLTIVGAGESATEVGPIVIVAQNITLRALSATADTLSFQVIGIFDFYGYTTRGILLDHVSVHADPALDMLDIYNKGAEVNLRDVEAGQVEVNGSDVGGGSSIHSSVMDSLVVRGDAGADANDSIITRISIGGGGDIVFSLHNSTVHTMDSLFPIERSVPYVEIDNSTVGSIGSDSFGKLNIDVSRSSIGQVNLEPDGGARIVNSSVSSFLGGAPKGCLNVVNAAALVEYQPDCTLPAP